MDEKNALSRERSFDAIDASKDRVLRPIALRPRFRSPSKQTSLLSKLRSFSPVVLSAFLFVSLLETFGHSYLHALYENAARSSFVSCEFGSAARGLMQGENENSDDDCFDCPACRFFSQCRASLWIAESSTQRADALYYCEILTLVLSPKSLAAHSGRAPPFAFFS